MLKHEFHALFRAPWRTGLFALLLAAAVAASLLLYGLRAEERMGASKSVFCVYIARSLP